MQTSFPGIFLIKSDFLGEAVCAENIVATMVFEGFPVSGKVGICTIWEGLGLHFGRFLGTLGDILVVWESPGNMLEFRWILGPSLGGPRLRQWTQLRGTCRSVGSSKQVTNHQLLTWNQLKANARLANC